MNAAMPDLWKQTRLCFALLLCAAGSSAQEAPAPLRPPEGPRIINLPGGDVVPEGTLQLLFTHRFAEPIEDSDIHSLFSFDSGADIHIGLAYSPVRNLEVSLDRSSHLDVYELAAKYRVFSSGPFRVALRAGADWRTEKRLDAIQRSYSRHGFFAQVPASVTVASRVRVTAVPTYVSEKSGQPFASPKQFYEDVFSVPLALSVAVTGTINIQGEVYPRIGHADSPGVGWIAAIEKTVLRHRFSFTIGNMRATTADQYTGSDFGGLRSATRDAFIGFNLVRQWKLK